MRDFTHEHGAAWVCRCQPRRHSSLAAKRTDWVISTRRTDARQSRRRVEPGCNRAGGMLAERGSTGRRPITGSRWPRKHSRTCINEP